MKIKETSNLQICNLPWKSNKISHSLHHLCSRICSFPPALVGYFILNYSKEGDIVCDTFSGKGTLPLEAMLNNRIGIGNDISPEAYILTKAKVSNIKLKNFLSYLENLRKQIDYTKKINGVDSRIKVFYHKTTLNQLIQIKEILMNKQDKYSIFAKAIILGILHGSSSNSLSLRCSHSYSMSPNYVKTYAKKHNLIKPKKDVIECMKNKAIMCLRNKIPNFSGKAINNDSRKLKLKSDSVNLIITSPPYFAVQTYAYDNWLRLWFLGHDYKDVGRTLVNTNSEDKYGEFMYGSFKEMFRILKKGSWCFIVVGDVKKKTSSGEIIINTAEFLSKRAEMVGFKTEEIIVDEIPQTKKVLNSSLCSTGITTERILCLKK